MNGGRGTLILVDSFLFFLYPLFSRSSPAPLYRWTIWPPTLARKAPSTGAAADGPFDVPDDVMAAITAKHHQFYGPWRALVVRDGLDKWTGYAGESEQLSDEGQALRD